MASDDPSSVTVEVLKEIRDEVRKTNGRLDQTNERLDQTNDRLGRLERRHTETEARLSTEIIAVAAAVRELTSLFREDVALRDRVDQHERRLDKLERKAG